MKDITTLFGSMVFNDAVMEALLPQDIYDKLKKAASRGGRLELDAANVVANIMKDWAVDKGATHYTHWFQPMTGITAGKYESFISPSGDGKVIMEFSGKELVRGEPDASSFPSGGLRVTFEARGYTVWDLTSYAFIKDDTLFIPTAFCSFSGEALDKKTPLLRSMEAIEIQALRILKLFGNKSARRVVTMAGSEQEYFLIDRDMFLKRPDLVYAGRTLFGARPPKGQELEDHYFGSLKPRISAFMKELDEELWKLGVPAKTRHNETAPEQHELALIYSTANIATDHNQLTMELMRNVANRYGLACLLHEKPFAGVNGSGKHNNWSLCVEPGANLLEPGETPYENAQFLLFLTALIKAVDDYQDLLRASVASAGNDHRLGGNEAPPAIMSVFLGAELTEILEALESGTSYQNREKHQMEIGVTSLPRFPRDTTDRNRTSPFAFTGNKFEFRMPGASISIADPNTVLNTAVAEVLRQFADALEASVDFKSDLASLIKRTFHEHKRIVYNGNNYADAWVDEAARRGLSNLKSAVEAFPAIKSAKSFELFTRHHVFSETELQSRYGILMEGYRMTLHIEALTMTDIVKRYMAPACVKYQSDLAELITLKQKCGDYDTSPEEHLLGRVSGLSVGLMRNLYALEDAIVASERLKDAYDRAVFCKDIMLPAMSELRRAADDLEQIVAQERWPFPTYADLFNSVI